MNEMYIRGTIDRIKEDDAYDEMVWTYFVYLRTQKGTILKIFDSFPISEILTVGEECELVVALGPLPHNTRIEHHVQDKPFEKWTGVISETQLDLSSMKFKETAYLEKRRDMVLITTSVGGIVASRKDFSSPVSKGDIVDLPVSQLDLLAIV